MYDLGLFMENNWLVYNTHWTAYQFVLNFLNQGLKFIIFPIAFPDSYPFILEVQSVVIAASIFPIYLISVEMTRDKLSSVLLASSYLIFFPVAGLNWFGAHFQAYFPLLFLTGFYFYIKNKYLVSILLLFISGMVRYPFATFPFLFGGIVILEQIWSKICYRNTITSDKRKLSFGLALMCVTGSYLLLGIIMLSARGITPELVIHYSSTSANVAPIFSNLDMKIITVVIILGSALFIPLYSPKWMVMLSVYFIILFYSNYTVFMFPAFITHQYGSLFVAFLYLGVIEVIARESNKTVKHKKNGLPNPIKSKVSFYKKLNYKQRLSITFVISITLFGVVYLPYGPLNQYSQASFNLSGNTNVNVTRYNALVHLVNMIPENASMVFLQDNIPQLFPRHLAVDNYMVMGLSVPYNLTFQTNSGKWIKLMPSYLLTYPYMPQYTYIAPFPLNLSMFQLAKNLYNTGEYGMLGEAYGMVLLKENYTGPIDYYKPFNVFFPARSFSVSSGIIAGNIIIGNNLSSSDILWEGPNFPLSPGLYKVTLELKTTNLSQFNQLTIAAKVSGTSNWLNTTVIHGSDFRAENVFQNFTFYIRATNFEVDVNIVQFPTPNTQWFGEIALAGISVQQVGP